MGKYQDRVVEYMQKKNTILKRITGLTLTTKGDFRELRTWSEERCRAVLMAMTCDKGRDSDICPWCIMCYCNVCGYSKRHGSCGINRYFKLAHRLQPPNGVAYLEEIQELVREYRLC